jgi:anti-sigma regulatory factor (Ser/Thr protein kinase)
VVFKDGVALLWTEVRCDRAAASAVRGAIEELDHLGWLAGDAMLVASELVTNVVTHTICDSSHRITIEVAESRDAVSISVCDTDESGAASPPPGSLELGGGLGLVIIDALAREWGTSRDRGYHVWAELAKRSMASSERKTTFRSLFGW